MQFELVEQFEDERFNATKSNAPILKFRNLIEVWLEYVEMLKVRRWRKSNPSLTLSIKKRCG